MDRRAYSSRMLIRYALHHIPGAVFFLMLIVLLRHWIEMPSWIWWGLIALWVVKDIALFPFVWRSYDAQPLGPGHSMLGATGIAKDELAPTGYIRVGGELWRAQLLEGDSPVESGKTVCVREIRGLTLLVEPCEDKVY